MPKSRKEAIILMCSILVAIAIHLGPVLYRSWAIEKSILRHKAVFNQMVQDGTVGREILMYLKILINNYESLDDVSILQSTSADELRKATESLMPVHCVKFLKYSPRLNMIVLGPLLGPPAVFVIKRVLGRKEHM